MTVAMLRRMWSFVCLFVGPRRFVDQATRHAIQHELTVNEQLREKFPTGKVSEEYEEERRSKEEKRTQKLRHSVVKTFWRVAALFLAAWLTSLLVAEVPNGTLGGLRMVSAGLILWAVIGRPGWEIQTRGGRSLPEIVGHGWFKATYSLGIYLLVLSMLLPARN